MLTDSYDYEDFVTTQIKCPPPKIIAVKRSLKRQPLSLIDEQSFIDDEDLLSKKDLMSSDDDSFSSVDSKDLIQFEPDDEPLIDLSDVTDGENDKVIRDTVSDMNARNSSTLLSLLDLLEGGSVTRTKETERVESCADESSDDSDPCSLRKSSSSSLMDIPVDDFSACQRTTGKQDELSSVFPPLSIEHEKSSLASFIGHNKVKLSSESLASSESDGKCKSEEECANVAKVIDCTVLKKSNQKSQQCENSDCENSISTSINFSCYNSLEKACKVESRATSDVEPESSVNENNCRENQEKEGNSQLCHNHHPRESTNVSAVNLDDCAKSEELPVKEKKSEKLATSKHEALSDSNNNRDSVCNQNSLSSLTLSHSLLRNLAKLNATNVDDRAQSEEECTNLTFLSPHTSQKKFPPEFYSSTNSLNQDVSFEASSRLKRLEERFKGFSYTKKLLRGSKVFSKSEEILSSIGRGDEFKFCDDPLNSSHSSTFPLFTATTSSDNCLRQLTDKSAVCSSNDVVRKNQFHKRDAIRRRTSYLADEISGEFDTVSTPHSQPTHPKDLLFPFPHSHCSESSLTFRQ